MKKLFLILFILPLLVACTPNWHRNQALLNAENEAQMMYIDANALIYYERMNADALILRAEAEAQAEVIRAKGIAEAMEIIQKELTADYLIHFWIRSLADHDSVMYVATEAGIPMIFDGERVREPNKNEQYIAN